MNAGQWPPCGASLSQVIVAASGTGRQDLATKADLAAAINKTLLVQVAVAGLLFAALKLL